jgi:hypothetical protein
MDIIGKLMKRLYPCYWCRELVKVTFLGELTGATGFEFMNNSWIHFECFNAWDSQYYYYAPTIHPRGKK